MVKDGELAWTKTPVPNDKLHWRLVSSGGDLAIEIAKTEDNGQETILTRQSLPYPLVIPQKGD